ncbi:hypothetical protein DL96DRAFT_1721638 [Flagelloscypha sp. PMI_526]|nr:hypothetical protein DL96DRAFT_1721638 [Flagelloscypha sp. PMI_526]
MPRLSQHPRQLEMGTLPLGADTTGLKTFQSCGILSSWGWNNDSILVGKTQPDIGLHMGWGSGINNPNRVNLGRTGLIFDNSSGICQDITQVNVNSTTQTTDLWAHTLTNGADVVFIQIKSPLLKTKHRFFLDFPWNDRMNKFSAPFMGNRNATIVFQKLRHHSPLCDHTNQRHGTHDVYEGINPNRWSLQESIEGHPALVGLHGWLPPSPRLNLDMTKWLGRIGICLTVGGLPKACDECRKGTFAYKLTPDPLLHFDDIGMSVGGFGFRTLYLPRSGALLHPVAIMARVWDSAYRYEHLRISQDQLVVRTEGIRRAL